MYANDLHEETDVNNGVSEPRNETRRRFLRGPSAFIIDVEEVALSDASLPPNFPLTATVRDVSWENFLNFGPRKSKRRLQVL